MRIAAIDLGTNTFRILISELENGKLKNFYRETNITRLGEGLTDNNIINEDAIKRSVSILNKYKNITEKYKVNKILAAGTSAFRNALNGQKLISYLHDKTGINIEILTGNEEAMLTVKGVLSAMGNSPERFYHLDIGGGSTEISFIDDGKIEYSTSLELGVVSLAECGPINNDLKKIRNNVMELLHSNIDFDIVNWENLPVVATSGTPVIIACILSDIKEFNPSRVNNMKIFFNEIQDIKNLLIKYSISDQLGSFGRLLEGREDLIIPGAIILVETMKYLKNDCMIISESGLLEGLSYAGN